MSDAETVEDGILEGADLCLCCVEPVRPGASLCGNCGAPQDFIAGTLPFLRVLAEGFVYRRAVQSPRSWLSVAGIWVIFGQLGVGGVVFLWAWFPSIRHLSAMEMLSMGAPLLANSVIGVIGIAGCTANYVAYRRSLRRSNASPSPPARG